MTASVLPRPAASRAEVQPEVIDDAQTQSGFSQSLGDGDMLSQLRVSGMHCAACAGIIERALQSQPGVLGAQVNAAAERLQLRWNPEQTRLSSLLSAVERAGYQAVPDLAAPARLLRDREHRRAMWRLFVASFMMMQVMMLAWPIYIAGPGEMSPDLRNLLNWGSWVLSLPVMLFAAGPFFSAAWTQLRQRRLGMDVPVSLGILVTFVASSGATFDPGGVFGHEVYFDSLTMFVSFLLAGRYLELRARHRVARELEQATAGLPDSVERIEPDGAVTRLSPTQLRVGDLLRVPAGQAFPADGSIEQGETSADEALLSGEAHPVEKKPGDEAVAGSINLQAPVLLRVLRLGADTRFEAIVRLMRNALTERPQSLRMADRIAGPFLWAVLGLALAGALAWSRIDPDRALWVAVSVLIVTCPCALSLAAPAAWLSAAGALARRGVLLARLDLLETLARIDTVVLDKTGTLTQERMQLLKSWPEQADAQGVLRLAASLAAHSHHVFARALSAHCPVPESELQVWREVRELPGRGMEALDADGSRWRLGSPTWVGEGGSVTLQPQAQLAFGRVGKIELQMQFGECLREDAREAIAQLRAQGLRTLLLSGDTVARAQAMADAAGLDEARGGASPEDKLAAVTELQAQGRCVLMVGDGINDAPVLARADASLAMGQGALIARAQADGVVLSGRLTDIVMLRALALSTRRVIRQNLAWAAAYNAACIPLALVGWLPPWAAGLGMALSSLFVIFNAMSLARGSGVAKA